MRSLWKIQVFCFLCLISFVSCNFVSTNSLRQESSEDYGTLTVLTGNGSSSRTLMADKIEKADVTVSGYGMTPITKNDVEVQNGRGTFTIERIPVGKNRIITIEAKHSVGGVLSKIDGLVIRNVVDINAGKGNSATVNWASTALGNVYSNLLSGNYDISSLKADDVKALLPTGVHSSLVDSAAIAKDIIDGNKTAKKPDEYKLNSSSVTFSASLENENIEKNSFYACITDPLSQKIELTGSSQTISDVSPGSWNFYITDGKGIVLYSEKVTVASGGSLSVNGGNPIVLKTLSSAKIGEKHPELGKYSVVSGAGTDAKTGSSISGGNATFVLYSRNAEKVLLEIYSKAYGESEPELDYWMTKDSQNYWRVTVKGLPENTLYAFRCWGPNWTYDESWKRGGSRAGFKSDCDSSGNRFNPNKVLFDPYAKEISHDKSNPLALKSDGRQHGGNIYSTGATTYEPLNKPHREVDTAFCAPKSVLIVNSDKNYGTKPAIPAQDASIYEAHARGITKHPSAAKLGDILKSVSGDKISGFENVQNVPSNLLGTYAGAAYIAPYLKALGINTIELLPVHESDNDANPDDEPGGNYWAYMTYGYFAPDRRYSSDKSLGGPTREFKQMVKAFHDNGMEVYLDVVYNHSGEGGTYNGATDNFAQAELTFMRGIDNSTYYSLVKDNAGSYWQTTGCGNNLQCDNPIVRKLILDSLEYWIDDMGVDGFRFDLATVLGRVNDGNGNWNYNENAQTLKDIVDLGNRKNVEMIAESWDTGAGSYQVGNFPNGWGGWNGRFRDSIRGYVNTGNKGSFNDFLYGDQDNFLREGGPHKSINFVVAHDGFTLADLVSYAGKGNETNGQAWPFGPSDGGSSDYNSLSFVDYTNENTKTASKRQAARNYIAIQMMSRGVPMIVWGDEFSRTQNGNNNPYNVDSVATWSNYNMINTSSPHIVPTGGGGAYHNNFGTFNNDKNVNGNFAFMQYMLNLRANEPALRQKDYDSVKYEYYTNTTNDYDMVRIRGSSVSGGSDYLLLMNMRAEEKYFNIPASGVGNKWVLIADTQNYYENSFNCWSEAESPFIHNQYEYNNYGVKPWSVVIFKQVKQ